MFGKFGKGEGELKWPAGIAIDANGLVYISEVYNNRVSVFTSEGQFVGRVGKGPGGLDHPRGLALDSTGMVFVCDSYNNRVQIYV